VPGGIQRALKQARPFQSKEHEVVLGLRIAAARVVEAWEQFLKKEAGFGTNQYNVLRILRGSHPDTLPAGEIASRMITRDPDVTRLLDRLSQRGLVARARSRRDRRVVEVGITAKGLAILDDLDVHARRYPIAMLGHLGPKKLAQLGALLEDVLNAPNVFP
jgi:DNA-binding MarR family transcriptional regulator